MSAPRETAAVRMHRMLAEVLWIAERDGPTVEETCERFGIDELTLMRDLELASMIGADEPEIDMPVDMYVEDGRVHVHLRGFDRPLRLTPGEALSLVVSVAARRGVDDSEQRDALGTAVEKLADLLALDLDTSLEVDLGLGDSAVVAVLEQAVSEHRAVEIDHIKVATDERRTRVVEPWTVFRDQGAWYLSAWCRTADGERVFRVDRIVEARPLDDTFEPPEGPPPAVALRPDADAPRLVLDLAPEARWVAESYPTESVEPLADGGIRVTLVVVSPEWAERLLLRLGPAGTVVRADPPLGPDDPAPTAARRLLARYGPTEARD